jgi:tripartite-type tricarboxylate transporter receptor subunit TctC
VLAVLNQAVREAWPHPPCSERLAPLGLRVQGSTSAEAQALLVAEIKRWGDVIRAAKIDPE